MGLSIRLVPDSDKSDLWSVAFRNNGPDTISNVRFRLAEGGIPSPGDLGSTITYENCLKYFRPSDELRMGSVSFLANGEYLDDPLRACISQGDTPLLSLCVTTQDFHRLEDLIVILD